MSFSISNLSFSYYQSVQSTASLNGASSIAGENVFALEDYIQTPTSANSADKATLSPGAQLLKNLKDLQTGSPTKFREILTQITTQLNDAAQLQAGNPNASSFLNSLTSQFQQVLETGSLSPLQSGVLGSTAHHGHHHHTHSASTYNTNGQTQASSSTSTDPSKDPLMALFNTIQTEVSKALDEVQKSNPPTSTSSATTQPTVSVTA